MRGLGRRDSLHPARIDRVPTSHRCRAPNTLSSGYNPGSGASTLPSPQLRHAQDIDALLLWRWPQAIDDGSTARLERGVSDGYLPDRSSFEHYLRPPRSRSCARIRLHYLPRINSQHFSMSIQQSGAPATSRPKTKTILEPRSFPVAVSTMDPAAQTNTTNTSTDSDLILRGIYSGYHSCIQCQIDSVERQLVQVHPSPGEGPGRQV